MTARIAIVDDHDLLAQSLALALQARGFAATPHGVTDLEQTLATVLASEPDVVLLDLQLGDAGHGLSLVRPLSASGACVLVVSGVTDECEIAATIEAGAVGFVSKSRPIDALLEAATRVAHGEAVMCDSERHRLLAALRSWRAEDAAMHAPFDSLTCREREVLHALVDGKSVTDIAESSFVSVATVRTQVRAILQKLEVGSQLEAVAVANRRGWYGRPAIYSESA